MIFGVLALALQMRAVALSDAPPRVAGAPAADSARDLSRAHNLQASFERSRRALLPAGASSGGRCDVRLGRFCWWYDESQPDFPPESETLKFRRVDLLAELDAFAERYPGDDWLAAMRVHYRLDGKEPAAADTVASQCRATPWWCAALVGYAAHARGDATRADSAFKAAVAAMPTDVACAWRNITPLLGGKDRDIYEKRSCDQRVSLEERYWMLSRPQFTTTANGWRNEFNSRRVLLWMGARSATPHMLSWGDDAAELVLRYGWPVAWSRFETSAVGNTEPSIIGHDPSPSFAFAPQGWLADSLRPLTPSSWDLGAPRSEARYAPPHVKRVGGVSAQFARFRRGDSTLVVAAFAAINDSLHTPSPTLGVGADAISVASTSDTTRKGTLRLMVAGRPWLAGVDVTDTTSQTLARVRRTLDLTPDSSRITLSDVLAYRAGATPAESLDAALPLAIAGDTATRNTPVGLFWETYNLAPGGETVDVSVTVERVDHSWIRSARQKLGLTPMDTPIKIKWTDAGVGTTRGAGRAISLDLGDLDAGRYRVTLIVKPESGAAAATTRELELIDP